MVYAALNGEILAIGYYHSVVRARACDSCSCLTGARLCCCGLGCAWWRPIWVFVDSQTIAAAAEFSRIIGTEHVAVIIIRAVCAGTKCVAAVASGRLSVRKSKTRFVTLTLKNTQYQNSDTHYNSWHSTPTSSKHSKSISAPALVHWKLQCSTKHNRSLQPSLAFPAPTG